MGKVIKTSFLINYATFFIYNELITNNQFILASTRSKPLFEIHHGHKECRDYEVIGEKDTKYMKKL